MRYVAQRTGYYEVSAAVDIEPEDFTKRVFFAEILGGHLFGDEHRFLVGTTIPFARNQRETKDIEEIWIDPEYCCFVELTVTLLHEIYSAPVGSNSCS